VNFTVTSPEWNPREQVGVHNLPLTGAMRPALKHGNASSARLDTPESAPFVRAAAVFSDECRQARPMLAGRPANSQTAAPIVAWVASSLSQFVVSRLLKFGCSTRVSDCTIASSSTATQLALIPSTKSRSLPYSKACNTSSFWPNWPVIRPILLLASATPAD
jgi:hypothetical protein